MTITKEQLQEWRALADNATEGHIIRSHNVDAPEKEITIDALCSGDMGRVLARISWYKSDADIDLWVKSRTIVPELIAEVEALKKLLERAYLFACDVNPELDAEIQWAIK